MKLRINYFVLGLFALIVFVNCSKEGDRGPTGETGAPGIQGEKGKDGSTVLAGKNEPSSSLGNNGDFYLDLVTSNLYGPKTEGNWGQPIILKGEQGVTGASFISGDQRPTEAAGKIGDFYFSKSEVAIYGPKSHLGWGQATYLAKNIKSGLDIYLVKDIKFDITSSNQPNYFAFYHSKSYNLNSEIDLRRGKLQLLWHMNDDFFHNANIHFNGSTTSNNYFQHKWVEMDDSNLVTNGQVFSTQRKFKDIVINFRVYQSLINSPNQLGFGLVGNYWSSSSISVETSRSQMLEFLESNTFDVLIKHNPEKSITVISKIEPQKKSPLITLK